MFNIFSRAKTEKDSNMPDTEKQPDSKATDTPPSPAGVSRDEFASFQSTINETLQTVNRSLEALAASRNANPNGIPTIAAAPAVKPEEIDALIGEGKGVGERVSALINERLNAALETHVNPLRNTGLGALAELTKEVVKPKMPYYDRFKKEIDGYVNTLPAEARTNPQTYIVAHNAVVGMHAAELIEEEKTKAVRASRDVSPTGTPSSESKGGGADKVPSFGEVFGTEAVASLRAKGQTPDAFAKRMGYENADAYIKFTLEQRGEGVSANA